MLPEVFLYKLTSFNSSITAIRKILLLANREGLAIFIYFLFISDWAVSQIKWASNDSEPGGNTNPEVKLLQTVFIGMPHPGHKSQVHTDWVDYPQVGHLHRSVDSFQLMTRMVHICQWQSTALWGELGRTAGKNRSRRSCIFSSLLAMCCWWACLGFALIRLAFQQLLPSATESVDSVMCQSYGDQTRCNPSAELQ